MSLLVPLGLWPKNANGLSPVYAAGPVDGARDWQSEVARIILPNQGFLLYFPRPEVEVPEDLRNYIAEGDTPSFPSLDEWADRNILRSLKDGVAAFVLPAQIAPTENPFSLRTMAHFGLALGKHSYDEKSPTHFCIGLEQGYPHPQMITRLIDTYARNTEIYTTAEDTAQVAMRIARPGQFREA